MNQVLRRSRYPVGTIAGGASGTDKKLISDLHREVPDRLRRSEWQWLKVRRRGHEISDLRSVKAISTGYVNNTAFHVVHKQSKRRWTRCWISVFVDHRFSVPLDYSVNRGDSLSQDLSLLTISGALLRYTSWFWIHVILFNWITFETKAYAQDYVLINPYCFCATANVWMLSRSLISKVEWWSK